jgi:hypothetical protein
LINRAKDIMANIATLTDDFKIGLHPINLEGEYWMRIWTHVLGEFAIREYTFPKPLADNIKDTLIPKYRWPGLKNAIKSFN